MLAGGVSRWPPEWPRRLACRRRPGSIPQRTKEQNAALGRQHKTAWDLYQALKAEAKGGQTLAAATMPDWSGVYSRPADKGFTFDPDTPPGVLTTAKLTSEYQAKLEKRVADVKRGIEWDPISTCAPPGHPRWLTEPFLREFVPTPNQTWLINEMVNDIRRVYTDGRDHVPAEDRYPLYNGDSIGFWDGGRLVVHTNQLQGGIYQRSESGLHRSGRDGGDLAADRRRPRSPPTCGSTTRRRWPSRGTCSSATRSCDPEQGAPDPLLELRRESEQRGVTRRRTARRSSTASPSTRRRRRSERGDEQTAGAGGP